MALRAHQLFFSSTQEDALCDGRVFRAFESLGMDGGGRVDLFCAMVVSFGLLKSLGRTEAAQVLGISLTAL